MRKTIFKIGDKVRVRKDANMNDLKYNYGSEAIQDVTYIVQNLDSYSSFTAVKLKGNNWCKDIWLELLRVNNKIGGKLL